MKLLSIFAFVGFVAAQGPPYMAMSHNMYVNTMKYTGKPTLADVDAMADSKGWPKCTSAHTAKNMDYPWSDQTSAMVTGSADIPTDPAALTYDFINTCADEAPAWDEYRHYLTIKFFKVSYFDVRYSLTIINLGHLRWHCGSMARNVACQPCISRRGLLLLLQV